jgi:hypothetical protein
MPAASRLPGAPPPRPRPNSASACPKILETPPQGFRVHKKGHCRQFGGDAGERGWGRLKGGGGGCIEGMNRGSTLGRLDLSLPIYFLNPEGFSANKKVFVVILAVNRGYWDQQCPPLPLYPL